jgi:hypothetical protein
MINNVISKQPVVQPASGFVTEPEDGGIAIIKYEGPDRIVCIPETIDGKPVTGIGERAFMDCRSLISVIIPESVSNIGAMAFFRCFSLKAISVSPENQRYKDIDGVLFTKDGKTLLTYPAGGKTVYTIPAGVTGIDGVAFSHCVRLTSVVIPESVTDIGEEAFSHCFDLKVISVSPENQRYKDIDGVLFTKDGKTLLIYPIGGENPYMIPNGVTRIGRKAFSDCIALTSVTIPEGVTDIGEETFYMCALLSVTIPASVATIGKGAFSYCGDLETISVSPENPHYKDIDGALFTKDGKTLITYPSNGKMLRNV